MKWWYFILIVCIGCSEEQPEYKESLAYKADMEVLDFYEQKVGRVQISIQRELQDRGKSDDSTYMAISKNQEYSALLKKFYSRLNPDSLSKDDLLMEAKVILNTAVIEKLDTTGLNEGIHVLENQGNVNDLEKSGITFLTNAHFNYLGDLNETVQNIESNNWRADKANYWIQENRNRINRDSSYRAKIIVFNEFGPNPSLIEKFEINDSLIDGHEIIILPESNKTGKYSVFSETKYPRPVQYEDDNYLIQRSKLEFNVEDCE